VATARTANFDTALGGWAAFSTTWTLLDRAPECVLAYVQVRALVGGTTAIQGWPNVSRPPTNSLIRCVDDDQFGLQLGRRFYQGAAHALSPMLLGHDEHRNVTVRHTVAEGAQEA